MHKEDSGSVSSWLVQQASIPAQGQTLSKSARSKSSSLRSKAKPCLVTAEAAISLDRTSSHVSTLSLDSASSAASGWSPRTAENVHSKQQRRSRKPDRILSGVLPARLDTQASPASADLVRESSWLSNVSLDSDSTLESRPSASQSSRLSPAKTTRQGSGTLLHTQHSILDPLPEKPTDVVRHRKVFGSTYSVGKLGELPYTPPPRVRGSLTQPPWVAAANQKKTTVASDPFIMEKLGKASSLTAITSDYSPDLESFTSPTWLTQSPDDEATAQSILVPATGTFLTCVPPHPPPNLVRTPALATVSVRKPFPWHLPLSDVCMIDAQVVRRYCASCCAREGSTRATSYQSVMTLCILNWALL